jgi:N-acetylmuramic acid 6-phosphate etherase
MDSQPQITEQRNPTSESIDVATSEDLLRIINAEDAKVAMAVEAEIPRIAAALDAIVERFEKGGRLFYLGAGTSGRLGVLDASECPPTYGVSADRVQGVIAGGAAALVRSIEGAEDNPEDAVRDLGARDFSGNDVLVGIAASGTTPYVLGAVDFANKLGAVTVGLSCSPGSPLEQLAEYPITPAVGAEVVTGSTRMKSGTAQKLVLNMISTGLMIRMGYVLGNLMVNLQIKNAKLADRARRIVEATTGCSAEQAELAIEASGGQVRLAILMKKLQLDRAAAERRLNECGDNLRKALSLDDQ